MRFHDPVSDVDSTSLGEKDGSGRGKGGNDSEKKGRKGWRRKEGLRARALKDGEEKTEIR